MSLGVLGAGAFGTALAIAQAQNGPVTLWARDPAQARAMASNRENAARLPGVSFPDQLVVTDSMSDLDAADVLLLAVPMQKLRSFLNDQRDALQGKALVACCKGVELETGLGPLDVIDDVLPGASRALLTGPSFAQDIARGLPTALTLACADDELCKRLQKQLSTHTLRLYRTSDEIGASLGGALKNAPYFGGGAKALPPDFNYCDHGLMPVHCRVWHDWVFVNLSEKPEEFETWLAPLQRILGDTRVEEYRPVATFEFDDVACNWKLLMENFIEPYHVQFVHKTTTDQPLEDHYTLIEDHCLGCVVEVGEEKTASADFSALGVNSHFLTLFPSFILGTYQPDQLGVYLLEPFGAERTR